VSRRKFREDKSKFHGTKQVLQDLNQIAHSQVHDVDPSVAGASNFRGNWSASTSYAPGNLVVYQGNLYLATAGVGPTTTVPSNDPSHWVFFAHFSGSFTGSADFNVAASGVNGLDVAGFFVRQGSFTIPSWAKLYSEDSNLGSYGADAPLLCDPAGGVLGDTPSLYVVSPWGPTNPIYEYDPSTMRGLRNGGGAGLADYNLNSIHRIGSTLYIVAHKWTDHKWYLRRYNQSDLTFISETDIDTAVGGLGTDDWSRGAFVNGANLSIVSGKEDPLLRIYTIDTAGAAVENYYLLDPYPDLWTTNAGVGGNCVLTGGVLYVAAEAVGSVPSIVVAYDFTTRKRRPELDWKHSGSGGTYATLAFDGTRWYHSCGSGTAILVGNPPALSNLTVGDKVVVTQAVGPYAGKGTRADEVMEDPFQAAGVVTATDTITVYWSGPRRLSGNYRVDYNIPG
jgi:hypothetical protein